VRRRSRPRRPTRGRLGALACVTATACAGGIAVQLTSVLDGLERETVKARFDVRGAERPDDVVVVGIDAKSFSSLQQQWPFPRSLHARAVRELHEAGAREIVYDVQFTEPTEPREDLALYRALDKAGGAVLATSESDGRGGTNVLGGDENLERINARAAASDLFNDSGGSIARFPRGVNGLEALAVVVAERAGAPPLAADAFKNGGARIDYRGPPETIRTVSFADVVRGRVAPEVFRDRVVVVGATAPTLRDVHATAVGGDELMAGPEVQANAVWTALHGLPLRDAPAAVGFALVALLALVAPLVGLRFSAFAAGLSVLWAGFPLLVGAQAAFQSGVIIDVVPPLAALGMGVVGTIVWSEVIEAHARRVLTKDNEELEARVRERTGELRETQREIAVRLSNAVESRDGDTGLHIERIGRFCERLALEIGMSAEDAELLRHASALHDVGKVGIPDSILLKPGRFEPHERELMQSHTTIGGQILGGSSSVLIQLGEAVALSHHEHWNGDGYPYGLEGEQIPLAGRICAICDVFDALLSPRPYKGSWPIEEVLAEIEGLSGTRFEPRLVDAFLRLAPELHREWFSHSSGALDRDPAQHVGHAVAGVDSVLDPLEDVLPANHHHRVDTALEESGEPVAQ
jgi:CHASE2 domain-containing sensor protein